MKGHRIDYRHLSAIVITAIILSVVCFCFLPSLKRTGQAFVDFAYSFSYYFGTIFGIEGLSVTVNDIPSEMGLSEVLPYSWDEFCNFAEEYGRRLGDVNNILAYSGVVTNVLFYTMLIAIMVVIPFLLVAIVIAKVFSKTVNNDFNRDSVPLKLWKRISSVTVLPLKRFLGSMEIFLQEHKIYKISWILMAALALNIVTIVVEAFAFYFYFAISFDFTMIYRQVYKLIIDLTVFSRIPFALWFVVVLYIANRIRKAIGYRRLERFESRNREFIETLPIVSMLVAPMGYGKTTQLVDMALSAEIMMREKALELLLKNSLLFPAFPWIVFEKEIQNAMDNHTIYNLATCKRYVRRAFEMYSRYQSDADIRKAVRKRYGRQQKAFPAALNCFGYDFVHQPMTVDDGLSVRSLWDVLEIYAQLYFVYIIESSIIISNFAVRTDGVLTDLGNFPIWNAELFSRDSSMISEYSRYSHILDFDMLRLGKKVVERNRKSNVFEFGVLVLTEVGKERGNMLETVEMKKNDEAANQKNDRFNEWMKMVRHSATIDNVPFVRVLMDEQRAMSLGADARELAYIIEIEDCSEAKLLMPWFSVGEILHAIIGKRFAKWYCDFRFRRGDNTLLSHIFKWVAAVESRHYARIYNTFSCKTVKVGMQNGSLDGECKHRKYYIMPKKIYSKRFATDAYADFFYEKAIRSDVGMDDLEEYASERAVLAELESQHSYFIANLMNNFEIKDILRERGTENLSSRENGKNP